VRLVGGSAIQPIEVLEMRINVKKAIVALTFSFATMAAAQTAADGGKNTVGDAATLEATVPKMDCVQPKIPQRFSVAPDDVRHFEKQVEAYRDCVNKFVEQRQAQAQKADAIAKAEADSGNAAVKEINDYFAQVKLFEAKNKPKNTTYGIGD
jgi:hypothetical protein